MQHALYKLPVINNCTQIYHLARECLFYLEVTLWRHISPGQVRAAERHGVSGLLLYTDVHQSGRQMVPSWAVRRASAYLLGDPSSPTVPSKSRSFIFTVE